MEIMTTHTVYFLFRLVLKSFLSFLLILSVAASIQNLLKKKPVVPITLKF